MGNFFSTLVFLASPKILLENHSFCSFQEEKAFSHEMVCDSATRKVSDLVDVKILAFELNERYADLLALKGYMKDYIKSKSNIDRGNFLSFLARF